MFRLVILLMVSLCGAAPAVAEQRVALVIGNSSYKHVPQLSNPLNDARDIAASMERLGFTVSTVVDANFDAMRKGLNEFGRRAKGADIAVIFFAGHGMEIGGENWLIPIDAELRSDSDAEGEAISLRAAMLQVAGATKLGLVVLDACRNNPFAAKMQGRTRTRAVERGFSRTEPTDNVLVAYAARDGTTANDGSGRNSPFSAALLRNLETPGLEVRFLFAKVRDDVMAATKREQQPFVYGSLSSDSIYLKPPATVVAPPAAAPSPVLAPPAAVVPPTNAVAKTEKFDRNYGPGLFDSVVVLPDGGFAVAGRQVELPNDSPLHRRLALVMRMDRVGNPVWKKTFGSVTDIRWATDIRLLPDDQLLVTGFAGVYPQLEWVAQLDGQGNLVRERSFGEERKSFERTVVPLTNGGYAVILDPSLRTGSPDWKLALLKSDGTKVTEFDLPERSLDCSSVMVGLPDSGFGFAWNSAKDKKDTGLRLRRYDSTGKAVFDQPIGTAASECPFGISVIGDELLITSVLSNETVDIGRVARIDASGRLVWEKRFGAKAFVFPKAVAGRVGGPIVVAGCKEIKEDSTTATEENHAYAVAWDYSGHQLWEKQLWEKNAAVQGGSGEVTRPGSLGRAVAILPDGGAVVAGSRNIGCGEIDGVADGGQAMVFTIPPGDTSPAAQARP